MHRLIPVVIAFLAFGSVASTAAGQVTTPVGSPAAASCVAPSLSSDTQPATHGTPGVEETGTVAGVEIGDEAPLPQITPPPGTPAGTAVLDRIRIAEENLSRCFNAGDGHAFTALFTPKALLAELGLSDPQATPAYSASYLILREQIFSVSDAETHADGRLSAEVVFAFEGQRMRARHLRRAGRLVAARRND
jgi:hypothetical protein